MKIKQLKLNNIGSFLGEHFFSFGTDNLDKNIVLIGGRNGAGKTTLFESMRLCMYGYKLYGYRQNSQVYTNKVKKLINDAAKTKPTAVAGISMLMLMEDGYANSMFEIDRYWIMEGRNLKESHVVKKDGKTLSFDELQDFDSYMLQILPPSLFRFHFFNGERISDFMFDSSNGQAFRKAFLQICGLDTFDLIEEQLQSNLRVQKGIISDDSQAKYEAARQALRNAEALQSEMSEQVITAQHEIDSLEEQIAALDKSVQHYGRIEGSEWERYQRELNSEEFKREALRQLLKNAANDVIPFIILKRELSSLQDQLIIEAQLQKNRVFREKLLDNTLHEKFRKEFTPFLASPQDDAFDGLVSALYDAMEVEVGCGKSEFLNFSEKEYLGLLAKINYYVSYDIQNLIHAELGIKDSLERVKVLRTEMESKEVIDSERNSALKNELLGQLDMARNQLMDSKIALLRIEDTMASLQKTRDKAYETYRVSLKARSVTDMAARSLLAFGELKRRLYLKYIAMVETSFSLNFRQLISKTDLIDGIYISSSFEVIAYKQSHIEIGNILAQIEEYGEEYVCDSIGERALQQLKECGLVNGSVSVQLKVEQHFSAGEQQIFVMALYQALAEIRTAELPFVIDTPLARIDSEHRRNILVNFFAQLPGQVIILSTDEEINEDSLSLIHEKISDVYLIENLPGGTSMESKGSYFKGVLS